MLRFLIPFLVFAVPVIFCSHERPEEFHSPETTASWFPGAIMAAIYCILIIAGAVIVYALFASVALVVIALSFVAILIIYLIYLLCYLSLPVLIAIKIIVSGKVEIDGKT